MTTDKIKIAIFDLDGVITQTASLHAEAWKSMFDKYNDRRKENGKERYSAFSIEKDYPEYIDGMPRYDGVNNFLKSRNIDLDWGSPEDEPGKETVCGLGNLKNEIFLQKLERQGARVIEPNVRTLKKWIGSGLKTAIVSSSKNCKKILRSADLEDLFDVRIDGITSVERDLKGKPAPDIFLEAAEELGFSPEEGLVVEDSLAGVEAGVKGKFGFVIGIGHGDTVGKMKELGADFVVPELEELSLQIKPTTHEQDVLPDALSKFDEIKEKWTGKKVFLFLDYDGTLTPIVEEFDKAYLSDSMREEIREVSQACQTAIISGRGMDDVKDRVKLGNVYYAGSHGFEISGPDDFYYEIEKARRLLPDIDKIEKELKENLGKIEGVKFERKKFALAVHYRQAAPEREETVKRIVGQVIRNYEHLDQGRGKKVIEIKTNVYWNKGKAIQHLLKVINPDNNPHFTIYIGDDITDEDAFLQISDGIGILVGSHGEKTHASYHLTDVNAVHTFLNKMTKALK